MLYMKRKHLDFETYFKDVYKKDKELRLEYDKLQPEFAAVHAVLDARAKRGFTQERLARAIGTKQSVISRLEKGKANPSVGFLQRLARALDMRLEVNFLPK